MICRPVLIITIFSLNLAFGQGSSSSSISYFFDGHYGQVEVGGRFAGVEFHHSRPLPSRISFYYPVANSIDLSTDYWKRDESRSMAVGVRIGNETRHWIGREPWTYMVSPHTVTFFRSEEGMEYKMKYEFCLDQPGMVFTFTIKNHRAVPAGAEVYTHLKASVRTCQTYARKDSATMSFDSSLTMFEARFDEVETGSASVFVENAGASPASWTSRADEVAATDSGTSSWVTSSENLKRKVSVDVKVMPMMAFEYHKKIEPEDSMTIVQIIGSCRSGEVEKIGNTLHSSWKKEVDEYDEVVRLKAGSTSHFITGDSSLDKSVLWAKGILTANAHYINGSIVPMPCPAEYNFFFTHDVLMTDLGAVNFDLRRVKNDLLYVSSHAKDDIIPHAYYWRDDGFKTEFCTPDNWNHFWFILLTGSYLRHSLDDSVGQALYPFVTKSLTEILTQVKSDYLMYAYRPDWWDIGHIEGPRAYTTILTIRALREYLFISSFLHHSSEKLLEYESLADSMQQALGEKLWDDKLSYLMNFNGAMKDEHFYMGSLLAVAYNVLDREKAVRLVAAADHKLMANGLGIRTVMPADFHTKESIQFYKFNGDEAGQPYLYINGGVWPHSNAWYALALHSIGRNDDALKFVKSTMTVDGIMHSPMGQPAMYEYRFTDPASSEYGRIDKPSFLWAGGFYLKTLYALFGVQENEWNISFARSMPSSFDSVSYSLTLGNQKDVTLRKSSGDVGFISADEKAVPASILPLDLRSDSVLRIRMGKTAGPYLKSLNAILHHVSLNEKKLTCTISSFAGHSIVAIVASLSSPKMILVEGIEVSDITTVPTTDGSIEMKIRFQGSQSLQHLEIIF